MKISPLRPLVILMLCFSHTLGFASIFQIRINDYGTTDSIAISAIDAVVRELEQDIRGSLPNADVSTYLDSTANAVNMAGAGTGQDYANNFEVFVAGISAGVGIDTGGQNLNSFLKGDAELDTVRGAGLQGAIMLGGNVGRMIEKKQWGWLNLKKLDLFVHGFHYNYDRRSDNRLFKSQITNFGFHGRYRFFDEHTWGHNLLRWGGVKLHSGYRYSSMSLNLENDLDGSASSGSFSANFSATGLADVNVTTHTIPVEVSTDIQLLYILSLYTGIGADFSIGKARANSSLSNSDITISGGGIDATGTAVLDLGDSGQPSLTQLRGFIGTQINILNFKVFAQLDQSFIHDLYGLSFGARFAF